MNIYTPQILVFICFNLKPSIFITLILPSGCYLIVCYFQKLLPSACCKFVKDIYLL